MFTAILTLRNIVPHVTLTVSLRCLWCGHLVTGSESEKTTWSCRFLIFLLAVCFCIIETSGKKILVNLSLNVLTKKGSYKKKNKECSPFVSLGSLWSN